MRKVLAVADGPPDRHFDFSSINDHTLEGKAKQEENSVNFMCEKSMYVFWVMIVGRVLAGQVSADLVAHWTFEIGCTKT